MRRTMREVLVNDFDPEFLAQVHIAPSGEDVEFNRLMVERADAGTLDQFGVAYNLPPGPILVYKGLAATRREVTEGEVMTPTPALPPAPPATPPTQRTDCVDPTCYGGPYCEEHVPGPDQTTLLNVTNTGTLSLAAIETEVAKAQAKRNMKPRPPRKRTS